MKHEITYKITPVSKPRMTQSDKWKKRKCVLKYWDFKDKVKELKIYVPISRSHVIFEMPMPKTWSKKKKHENNFTPHKNKPDVDNLLKALLDCLYDDDSIVWNIEVTKIWSYVGCIKVHNQ